MEWVKIFSGDKEARSRIAPDKPQLVVVYQKRICLVRHNEKFFAVQDACTHHGESLSKGTVNTLGEIVCPWHNYRFELNGGRACDSTCPDLRCYPIKSDESGFFIGV